jgi:hypothetical protein
MGMDIEAILKWGIIGGVAVFGTYMVYQFATKQGWLKVGYRQRLTRMKT